MTWQSLSPTAMYDFLDREGQNISVGKVEAFELTRLFSAIFGELLEAWIGYFQLRLNGKGEGT